MYGIIRIIICIILVVLISLLAIRKKVNKKIFVLCITICIIFNIAIWFIPFENLLISFDSPKDVFYYAGSGSIVSVVEGTDSVAIITKKGNNNFSTFFVLKDNDKYKIAGINTDKELYAKHYNSLHVYIYQIKGTNDYYLRIWGMVPEKINISDSIGTNFEIIYEDFSDKKIINAIGKINSIEDYSCYIDDYEMIFN